MKRLNHITALLGGALLMLLSSCGESLEDTYKDYAGDGSIRYVGRCRNISANPGWERVVMRWTNNVDPVIAQVKLKWGIGENRDSVLLPAGTKEYSIEQLNGEALYDATYEITLSSVDKDGTESLTNTVYARPYTFQHEEVMAFNRLVSNVYRIKNRLVLKFLPWQEGIHDAYLYYTKLDGSRGQLELTPELVADKYLLLADEVDNTKPVYVQRTGLLATCEDEIEFEPVEFDQSRVYNSDFVEDVRRQYGIDEIPDSWADRQTTIYLDRDYNSLIDLLNFPNAKRVVLGSRRYFPEDQADDEVYAQNAVLEPEESDYALRVLHELNGIVVERYNHHYPQLEAQDFFKEMGAPAEPNVRLIDVGDNVFKVYPEDEQGFNSHLANLTDGDYGTYWEPMRTLNAYTYQLVIDLGQVRNVSGVKIVQRTWENEQEQMVAPEKVSILISADGEMWGYPTYLESVPLGRANGERNYIDFAGTYRTRLVAILVTTANYFNLNFTSLAEIEFY